MAKIVIILIALLGGVYRTVLGIVRLRSAENKTPQSVADVYDSETYEKWKKYSAEHGRLEIGSGIISCLVSLILLCFNVYSAFASLFPSGWWWGLFSIILLESVVNLPIEVVTSYISNMIIEQKYGFNRSTIKTFVTDRVRGFLIGLILSSVLAVLMATLHMSMGNWIIVLFAVAVFVISLLISFLYPIFSRIGNKFVPLEEGELKDRLLGLLEKHGYKVKAIEVMDASRRTTKLNAYFTGFGKLKTIVLYDNLVNAMSTDEICAVFAHELGHGINRDVLKSQILNIGNLLCMSVVVWLSVSLLPLHTAFGFEGLNYGFAYILTGIGLALVQPLTSMVMNARSRRAEYRADAQAVREGYGEAMISALKKLAKENFAHLSPSRVNVVLEYSHPPLADRIEAVEIELGKGEKA